MANLENKRRLMPVSHFFLVPIFIIFSCLEARTLHARIDAEEKLFFSLTPLLQDQYRAILTMDWDSVSVLSQDSRLTDKNNVLVYLFDNYALITKLLIEDRETSFYEVKRKKQEFLKIIRKADKNSPYFKYVRAEILLQWALLNYKYGHRLEAFTDVWTAYDLLEDNIRKFPNFILNYRSFGLLRAFLGTLPISDSMKWLLKRTSGMSGSIDEGLAAIQKVLIYSENNPGFIFEDECRSLMAYLTLHLKNQPEKGWDIIQDVKTTHKSSPMVAFAKANLALKTGRLITCIDIVDGIRPDKVSILPFNLFLKARAEMYLQLSECRSTFSAFLKAHEGETYRYATYQKIAWSYLIEGDKRSYEWWISQCRPNIELRIGEDKDAHEEAKKSALPNSFLLKARLYFDSQQFVKGLALLKYHPELADNSETSLEYYYRSGRIFQGLQQYNEAEVELKRAYELGVAKHDLYACNAALQLGLIFENTNEKASARYWFNRCLEVNPSAYRKSLHHKAKAGLKRL